MSCLMPKTNLNTTQMNTQDLEKHYLFNVLVMISQIKPNCREPDHIVK